MSTITFDATFPIETILRNPQIRKALRDREDAYLENIAWLDEDLAEKRHLENIAWLDEDLTNKIDEDASLSEKQQGQYQRCGKIDENKCQARIWITKPETGGLGYPDIQCSHGRHRGGTYCKVHHGEKEKPGSWWLGDITDPPLKEVFGPPGRPSGQRMHKFADP
jgi:hypothetical protein